MKKGALFNYVTTVAFLSPPGKKPKLGHYEMASICLCECVWVYVCLCHIFYIILSTHSFMEISLPNLQRIFIAMKNMSHGCYILLQLKLFLRFFPKLNVVAHLVVPAGLGFLPAEAGNVYIC